ncbi:hypothetical protein Pmar_PMAR008464, partial [Perkinsus marinus ATCC 50983]
MEALHAVSFNRSFLALPEFRLFVSPLSEVASTEAPPITINGTTRSIVENQEIRE